MRSERSHLDRSQNDHLWQLVHAERAALAEDLSNLSAEQWHHRTLCGQWDVEQVLAHLTAAATLNQWQWFRSMFGAHFRPDVHNQRRLAEHCGKTPAETLDIFRTVVKRTTAPSGHTPAYLGEVVVHSQDIRQPLGILRTPGVDALTPRGRILRPTRLHCCQSYTHRRPAFAGQRRKVRYRYWPRGYWIYSRPGDEHGWPRNVS